MKKSSVATKGLVLLLLLDVLLGVSCPSNAATDGPLATTVSSRRRVYLPLIMRGGP